MSAPNSPKTKRGANGKFLPKPLLFHLRHPNSKTNEGMKVVLGKYPESGNIFILPSQSDDIENDSISPSHLQISETMDERLKKLILMNKG